MKIEFFPQATRLLQNDLSKIKVSYMSFTWELPTIASRPPYYTDPVYRPYYPLI